MRAATIALVILHLAAISLRADADEDVGTVSAVDEEEARAAFVRGARLAKRGEWREALTAFEESASLRPHPVTIYNLGYCERALGRYTRARKRFREALDLDAQGSQGAMPPSMRAYADEYLAESEARIIHLTVTLAPPGAALAVDGRPLERMAINEQVPVFVAGTRDAGDGETVGAARFELWLDPGRHVFVASHDGVSDRVITEEVPLPDGGILALNADPLTKPHLPVSGPAIDPITWPILAYGAAGVGVAVTAVFGIATLERKAHLDAICGPDQATCPPGSEGDQEAVKRHALVSTIGLGAAVGAAALGTVLLFVLDDPAVDSAADRSIDLALSPVGFSLHGRM